MGIHAALEADVGTTWDSRETQEGKTAGCQQVMTNVAEYWRRHREKLWVLKNLPQEWHHMYPVCL